MKKRKAQSTKGVRDLDSFKELLGAKPKKQGVPKDRIAALVEELNKTICGQAQIRRASEYRTAYHIRRPTGITGIDAALRGGWPAGALSQIYGPEGQGKDYLLNCTMRELQRRYGADTRIFIASFGYPVHDLAFAEACGVDLDLGQIYIVEYDVSQTKTMKPAEHVLEACLGLVASGEFQLGILNEVGAEVTKERAEKDLSESSSPGDTARLITEFTKRFSHHIGRPVKRGRITEPNTTTMLTVVQVRENISPYGSKYTMPGGHALRHLKAVDLHLHPAGPLKNGEDLVGRRIRWTIRKGKLGIHDGPEGVFDYYFDEGAKLSADLVDAALVYKAIVLVDDPKGVPQPGVKVAKVLRAPDVVEAPHWHTRTEAETALENSPSLYAALRADTLTKAKGYPEEQSK